MKKLIVLLSVSSLLLIACEGDETLDTDLGVEDVGVEEVGAEDTDVEEVGAEEDTSEEVDEPVEEVAENSNEIILGEPIILGDYTMTIQSYKLGKDYEGKDALIINYDWVNNSDDSASPFMTFILKGFQNGVETEDIFMVDGVDLGIGQKEVRPGGIIEGAQDVVGIDDMNGPLELELDELFSFEDNARISIIDLSTLE